MTFLDIKVLQISIVILCEVVTLYAILKICKVEQNLTKDYGKCLKSVSGVRKFVLYENNVRKLKNYQITARK